MAIIPMHSERIADVYYCPVCEGYYAAQVGEVKVRCAVNHAPGQCCHYGEKELTKEQVDQIRGILKGGR